MDHRRSQRLARLARHTALLSQRHITILLAVMIAVTSGILVYRLVAPYVGPQSPLRQQCLQDLTDMAGSTGHEGYYWSRMRQCVELGGLSRDDFDLDRLNR